MDLFAYIQGNLISIIVLLMLYFNRSPGGIRVISQKYYDRITLFTVLVIIADSCMWLFNGQTFKLARELNIFASYMCYFLTPIIGMLCIIYIDFKIHCQPIKRMTRRMIPIYASVVLCESTLLVNAFTDNKIIFSISAENQYSRGSLYLIFTVIPFIHLIICSLMALRASLREKNPLSRREYVYLTVFIVPPIIGGTLQAITGLSFTWSFVMISLVLLFIKVQSQQISTDQLTGINNRRQLENYLEWQSELNDAENMYALMIDIDHFKSINDNFSHAVGDEALINVARLLEGTIGKGDFLARFGGDEFLIITHHVNRDEVAGLINRVNSAIDDFNNKKTAPYSLSLSIGTAKYSEHESIDRFVAHADDEMYRIKAEKKR